MQPPDDTPEQTEAERLNQHCACATLDRAAIAINLASQLGDDTHDVLSSTAWQQFFSDAAIFVPGRDLDHMQAIVQALEAAAERPERIAIVDDQPFGQYLYPEFRLAQQLLRNNGIDAVIFSPSDFRYESGALYGGDKRIDLVYNRLVDFGLEMPEHAALRSAWLGGGAVITPNPYTHALFADKRNLTVLSDRATLLDWGLSPEYVELLRRGIPRTVTVTASNGEDLWQQRRQWFFKPVAGHGSKGVYSGSKLTKSTFARILESDYIAQAYVPPSGRLVLVDGAREVLKVDVRLYTYRGTLLLAAARLYRGQTTNFRKRASTAAYKSSIRSTCRTNRLVSCSSISSSDCISSTAS